MTVWANEPSFLNDDAVKTGPHGRTQRGRRFLSEKVFFAAIVFIAVEYGIFFIARTSFVLDGIRYFSLFDDAMISMRYARNLARGLGLVWNPGGEHVEGYTNFLWVLVMAAFHLLPVAVSKISLCIQLLSLALLLVNLWFVRKTALYLSNNSAAVSLGSVILTAFYFPIINWSLQGMEVGLLLLLTTAIVGTTVVALGSLRLPRSTLVFMCLAVLTRSDMIMLCFGILIFHSIAAWPKRKRIDFLPYFILSAVMLLHTAFRVLYYGDPLPNTYYLKLTGVSLPIRLAAGFSAFKDFIFESSLLLYLIPLMLFFLFPGRRREVQFFFLVVVLQMAYSVFVGGDAWEWYGGANRHIAIVMPLMFILLSWALHGLLEHLTTDFRVKFFQSIVNLKPLVLVFLIGYAFYAFNADHWLGLTLQVPPLETGNNQRMVKQGLFIKDATSPDATIAVAWAGAIPYFADRTAIDLLGKNDRFIARLPVHESIPFTPGHNKWDYVHSIKNQSPDVVVQLWKSSEAILPFLEEQYEPFHPDNRSTMFFKKASPRINVGVLEGAKLSGE